MRLENDDSFADLQIKCLQSYLSTCFDNLNTNNGMPTTSILNGHRKLMIAINDIYASYQEELKKNIGGEEMEEGQPKEKTYDSPRSYCSLAIEELSLSTYSIEDTLKGTGDSYRALDLL